MSSRRSKAKGAIAGLRSIQTLGSVAVPVTLEQVPEESEVKSTKQEIFASNDWKSVQRAVKDIYHGNFSLEVAGEFYKLHQNVKNILESKTGTFLRDCYKEWLTKEMDFTAERMRRLKGPSLLQHLEEVWTHFFKNTLPLLDAVMYLVKPKGRVSIRGTSLATFRDVIALSGDIEGAIRYDRSVSPGIKHMIFILQSVNDSYPPNKSKLRIENLAAQICDVYLGYYGLYENGDLTVTSSEPMLAGKRRPSADAGPRRISRPFTVQPQTLDTLDELFKKSVIDAGISAKDLVISFFVYSPSKRRTVMRVEKKSSKIKRISIMESGDYEICLDNSFSVMSSKTVYFELSIEIDPQKFNEDMLDDLEGIIDNSTLSRFRKTAKTVLKNLETIKHYYDTYRTVEARDINLQEKNLMKVNTFSSLTVVFIMMFGSLHLFVLKSMFNRKSLIYKVLKILC